VRLEFPYHVAVSTDVAAARAAPIKQRPGIKCTAFTLGKSGKPVFSGPPYTKFKALSDRELTSLFSLSRSLADGCTSSYKAGRSISILVLAELSSRFVTERWTGQLARYFIEGLYTGITGTSMSYRQMNLTFGYRFGGFLRK